MLVRKLKCSQSSRFLEICTRIGASSIGDDSFHVDVLFDVGVRFTMCEDESVMVSTWDPFCEEVEDH